MVPNPTPPPQAPQPSLWRRLLEHDPDRYPRWIRWSFAVVITIAALWLRMWMGSPESGARFATLTLAGVLAALLGGFSAGLISTVVGLLVANFFLVAPYGKAAVSDIGEALWLSGTFFVTMLVVLGAVWMMQVRSRRLLVLTSQLAESQDKFQNIFEHAASGITIVGLQGQLLDTNQRFCDLVGYTHEELIQMSFQKITLPQDLSLDLGLLKEALNGQRSQYTLEKRYIRKDGHIVWAQLTVALMRDAQGAPDYFISVVQDISQIKATEEALRTSDKLMKQAQAVAGFITWEADITRQTFRALSNEQRWLKLPPTHFGDAEISARVHPEDQVRMVQEWVQAIKSTGNFLGYYRGHPDGDIAWFLIQANFERDEKGHAMRAYGVTQDISTRKLAELEIQHLNASLERRIQERTEELKSAYGELESYSYAVAHDLRSPLRIINGFAQALEEDNQHLDSASKQHIERIKSASRHMGLLIDGLLKLSQYTRGNVQRQPIDISAIASRLLTELSREQPERVVDWSVEPGMHAQADPALIEAMLQNLLHNAWKYTAKTTGATIRVFQETDDNGAPCYCVTDNGAGFDMALSSKLFQPFQRLHMPHEFAGLGVGLATARRIVQKHGGELRAQGTPGQGARFCYNLPNGS
jgi:PAS domain S-box-containing protein